MTIRRRKPSPARPRTAQADRAPAGAASPGAQEYIALQERVNRGLRGFIDEMTAAFRFIETISEFHSLDRILDLFLAAVREMFPYVAAAVYLEERLEPADLGGQTQKRALGAAELDAARGAARVDEALLEWVFKQGRPIVLPAAATPKTAPAGSLVVIPLATSTERVGRLELLFDRPAGEFTQQTFSILGVLCKHAALIVANERGYEQEHKTAKKYMELDRLKQDIVNTTTHEIKTPLTIINASALMLRKLPPAAGAERGELLEAIVRQCGRIDRIVNQLVETALLEENRLELKRVAIRLPDLARELLRDVPHDPARLSLQANFPPDLAPVEADYDSLYKILRNLLENAVKYSPQGGQITLTAENQESRVMLQIRDQGVGIPDADQAKIFEKFYRVGDSTTRRTQGMGFGLYIVKKNVELNGGTISVKSKLGEGSTFTLILPRAELSRP